MDFRQSEMMSFTCLVASCQIFHGILVLVLA